MGFSLTITHIIVVIASVILASAFVACALYTGNVVQNEFTQAVSDAKSTISTQVEIVYATANQTGTPVFAIYAKNVGKLSINDFTFLDVYVGNYGSAQLYNYDATAAGGSGKFTITDANGNGVWEPRETATILAYPTGAIDGSVLEAKIVPSKGIGSDYLFSAPAS
ncbi:MAG: flagellin [Candidatus Bathyarchaeota archaeon]|nr:flagellin [Candidatus Bathyarchaeota archaeon]